MANYKYKPEFAVAAVELAQAGATNRMLAAEFGVHENTIIEWRKRHPEFGLALEQGKTTADIAVERSLYDQAVGYSYETEESKVVKDKDGNERLEVVTVTKHIPAKTTATIFFLKNRQPEIWRDKSEVSHSDSGLESILAEVMNTSRGLPSKDPRMKEHLAQFRAKYLDRTKH